jgi:hypothetical protein
MQFLTFETPIEYTQRRRGNSKIKNKTPIIIPPKSVWHPYELQNLTTGRFIDIVNQIIKGQVSLLPASKQN